MFIYLRHRFILFGYSGAIIFERGIEMQKIIITEANSNTLFISMKRFTALFGTTTIGQEKFDGAFYLSTENGNINYVARDFTELDAFMHGAIAAAKILKPDKRGTADNVTAIVTDGFGDIVGRMVSGEIGGNAV